jgi:hypothetical protein
MKDKYKLIDNFLPQEEFLRLKNILLGADFPWYYNDIINDFHENNKDLTCYFTHNIFNHSVHSNYFKLFEPILNKIECKALIRIKANLYPRTDKIEMHEPHCDYNYTHKGAILYINTNNGKTILTNGTKIDSIENRMLFFESHKKHSSTSTTSEKVRININFNYF